MPPDAMKHEVARPEKGLRTHCFTVIAVCDSIRFGYIMLARARPRQEGSVAADIARVDSAGRIKSFIELTKPRLASLLVVVAAASFYLASPARPDWPRLILATLATGVLAAGVLALNSFSERDSDALMRRTASRPLPSGRIAPLDALAFGAVMTALAVAFFTVFFGWSAGGVALFTFVSYNLLYTPLKQRTDAHTTIGALSGAMPPLLGWACARGVLSADAWVLFGILFLWQYPHFLSIDTMYRDDYARAGIKVLPGRARTGERATHAVMLTALALLLIVGTAPFFAGMAGTVYLVGSLMAGAGFMAAGIRLVAMKTKKAARVVLLASVTYLPLVFGLLVLDAVR